MPNTVTQTMSWRAKLAAVAIALSTSALIALVMTQDGQAANGRPAGLNVIYSSADMDHALKAFDPFRNQLDAAPRRSLSHTGG